MHCKGGWEDLFSNIDAWFLSLAVNQAFPTLHAESFANLAVVQHARPRRAVELLRALASGHAVSISEVPQEQMRTLRKVKQPPMRSMRLLAPTVQSELLA